ncbi:chemokine-like receptor 1 [Microcaecilia unicolor]|uniref:Chemokine-like receptor 1 n=1 Tax=Microcaecilia unicolor TaxID=1415580 RepID=A0A6P7YST6_9AMPH|nr:chemokine-like receptor 1 [Microcaecilia unicolor]
MENSTYALESRNSTANTIDYEYYYYTFEPEENEQNSSSIWSLHIVAMVFYSVAFLLGVTGNGLVIWITLFKMKMTVNTVWFLNLAIADFIFTFFLPLSIAYTALDFHWPFGLLLCKLNSFVAFLNLFASVFILMIISIDRCISVIFPVWSQNHRNTRIACIIVLAPWFCALVMSIPYAVFRDIGPDSKNKNIINCYYNFALSSTSNDIMETRFRIMVIIRFVLGFLIPFVVIVICYTVIAMKVLRNQLTNSSRPFKIIIAVIVSFFLCWLPYHIFSFLNLASASAAPHLRQVVKYGTPLASSLAFLNSCVNPILYVFIGKDFKEKLRTSILAVFENAFSEEHTQTSLKSKSNTSSTDCHAV